MELRQALTSGELSGWLAFQEKVTETRQSPRCAVSAPARPVTALPWASVIQL